MAQPRPPTDVDRLGPFGEDFQRVRTRAHQSIADAATKAPAVGEQMDSFKQAGLARAVGAEDQVDPRTGHQVQGLQIADAGNGESGQSHDGTALAPTGCTHSGPAKRLRPARAGRSTGSTWNTTARIRDAVASPRGGNARW